MKKVRRLFDAPFLLIAPVRVILTHHYSAGDLTRHLLFTVIAYRIQADRLGDLDHETKQVLDRTVAKEPRPAMSTRLASFDQKRTELSPGTGCI
jgi:hypothetical protein